jgi:hypothetical protein
MSWFYFLKNNEIDNNMTRETRSTEKVQFFSSFSQREKNILPCSKLSSEIKEVG